jgi:uncharacterized iron-regulated membrane protein
VNDVNFGTIVFLVVCATILVLIWQGFATYRARASAARENAYRKLAEEASAAQKETAAALADIRPRIAAIEKLIRDFGD